ncbi:hypothetical protein QQS21_003831 [Conoideocrella luteorostrata]|uniref:Uncharacterized protein n=1 Tax=Conoideocrella luteorostrata TaxID=1105319 RepID=A0AAJ0CVK5_9HYPO|nr:hypothetical protein QQS21_003831 [Conoideocrella luteorostrata]
MSDAKLMRYTDNDTRVTVLNGAVEGRLVSHPDRSFALEISLDLEKGKEFFVKKPPLHFHMQEEYIESIQGTLGLEIEGREIVLNPKDGRYPIKPFVDHRSYPMPLSDQKDGGTVVKFLLSGKKTDEIFELNPVFFENWYKYQDQFVVHGEKLSFIQLFSTFDAGGTYVSLPPWVPFGQSISMAIGVVVGRWLGGILGYQPFYRKWTTDWDLACSKMETSFFQRRFADRSLKKNE